MSGIGIDLLDDLDSSEEARELVDFLSDLCRSEMNEEPDASALVRTWAMCFSMGIEGAESEPALEAFINLNNLFGDSSFDATEREIIEIATSVENQCTYCVAGHTAFAHMQGVPAETIEALRNSSPLSDARLEALNTFTRALVRNRGMVDQEEVELFIDAGYTPRHVMEVILGICVKTFSNLASNAVRVPVDAQFEKYAWPRPEQISGPMGVPVSGRWCPGPGSGRRPGAGCC